MHPVLGPFGLAESRQGLDPYTHGPAVAAIGGDGLLGPFQGDPGDPPGVLSIAQGCVTAHQHLGRIEARLDERGGLFEIGDRFGQPALAVADEAGPKVHLPGLRIEPQGDGDLGRRRLLPARFGQHHRLQRAGLGQIGVEGQGAVQGPLAAIVGPAMAAVKVELPERQQSPGLGVAGIDLRGPAAQALDRLVPPRIADVAVHPV